jgi:chemotaxis protein CheC
MDVTAAQLEALKEIGNIGSGHAATSLSDMLQSRISMDVPRVWLLPLNKLTEVFGELDSPRAAIYLKITGEAPGKAIFVFSLPSVQTILDTLLGKNPCTDIFTSELAQSALKEVGNILVGSFIMVITEFSGVKLYTSIPALGIDMIGAMIETILIEEGKIDDNVLIFDTKMTGLTEMEGKFLYIPNEGSLKKLVRVFDL